MQRKYAIPTKMSYIAIAYVVHVLAVNSGERPFICLCMFKVANTGFCLSTKACVDPPAAASQARHRGYTAAHNLEGGGGGGKEGRHY